MKSLGPRFDVAVTLAVALAGGALGTTLNLPIGWLLGSAIAVTTASLAGLNTRLPNGLRTVTFFVLGVQAGAGVTPDVAGQLAVWPLSFAIQMIGVAGVVAVTYVFLRKGFGWDNETALFASLPGAMGFVLAAASQTRTDMARIVIVQSVRLLLLLGALTPTLAWLQGGGGAGAAIARGGHPGTLAEYGLLLGTCVAGSILGALAKVPGGMMLGALIGSAVMHVTGLAEVVIPLWISTPALTVLGAVIGSRIRPEHRRDLVQMAPAALGAFAIGLLISGIAGFVAHLLLAIDFGKLALAYAPGALEALTVLAFQFDLDPAYVASHHVVRFVCIALLVPFLARRVSAVKLEPEKVVDWRSDDAGSGVDRGKDGGR
ncbi:AbrB family transcriptional regulator [Consotaella aegiceratis]|uniref:AbrB family transcriptional regulator n=1 Tax=Consotaella aegiceratis TaxID=3097961 RepID=UPI002F3F1D2F